MKALRRHDSQLQSIPWMHCLIFAAVYTCSINALADDKPRSIRPREVEEVIVTAQRRSERLEDVPMSISVLEGHQLESFNAISVNDVLNSVPGIATNYSSYPGTTSLSVRGVTAAGMTFSGSSPIGFYVDSVPFGFVRSAMVPDVGIYDLRQVEVLRGPQGTLYGANALNGVVRVLTNDANPERFEFKARASLSSMEDGSESYRGDTAVNVPIVQGKLAARAALSYAKSGGWIDTLTRRDSNDTELGDVRLKLNAQPTENFSIGLSYWRSSTDLGAFNLASNEDVYPGIMATPTEIDFDSFGLRVGYEFSRFSISSMSSYIDYNNHNNYDITPFSTLWGIPSWYGELGYNEQDSKVFSQEGVLSSTDTGPWRWTLGSFYRDAEDHVLQQAIYFNPSLDSGDKSNSFALFGELTRTFMDGRFELTGGLRYFEDEVTAFENVLHPGASPGAALQHDTDKFDKVSPRVVLTWHPSELAMVYASFGEGFRSGFSQTAFVKEVAPQFPPAKPDTLRNYELGAKGSVLDGRIIYDTAAYYIDWQDVQQGLVVLVPSGSGVFAILNGQSASGVGLDFQMNTRLAGGFELGANLSWNDLSFDEDILSNNVVLFKKGDRLNGSVKSTVGASAGYAFPIGSTGLQAHFSISASYHTRQTSRSITGRDLFTDEGDDLTHVRTGFSIDSESNWVAEIFVDNATDDRGNLTTSSSIPFYQLRTRPRTIGLQFEYRHGRQ